MEQLRTLKTPQERSRSSSAMTLCDQACLSGLQAPIELSWEGKLPYGSSDFHNLSSHV